MASGLEHLLAEGVISEVIARLQSGKEAEVYVVRFGGNVVAAKVYKDRAQRSFKNNALYKEGRAVRNSRSQRAMDRGSRFGKAAAEDAWKTAEADALYKLHAAEVRVPTPVLYLDGVLLMELVQGPEGDAARRIIDTPLTVSQANAAYHDMLGQLVRILSCDLIHGDLSPYNVLWGAAGPVIIDFPQIVSASHNSSSEQFFLRDADNILGYFARIDRSLLSRRGDPREIWNAYRRRELTPDFRPTGHGRPTFSGPRPIHDAPRGNRPPQGHAPQGHAPQGHAPQGHPQHGQAQQGQQGRSQQPQHGRRPQGPGGPRRSAPMPEVIVRHSPASSAPAPAPRHTSTFPVTPHPHERPAESHAAPRPQRPPPQAQPQQPRAQDPRARAAGERPATDEAAGGQPSHRRRRRRR